MGVENRERRKKIDGQRSGVILDINVITIMMIK